MITATEPAVAGPIDPASTAGEGVSGGMGETGAMPEAVTTAAAVIAADSAAAAVASCGERAFGDRGRARSWGEIQLTFCFVPESVPSHV